MEAGGRRRGWREELADSLTRQRKTPRRSVPSMQPCRAEPVCRLRRGLRAQTLEPFCGCTAAREAPRRGIASARTGQTAANPGTIAE